MSEKPVFGPWLLQGCDMANLDDPFHVGEAKLCLRCDIAPHLTYCTAALSISDVTVQPSHM